MKKGAWLPVSGSWMWWYEGGLVVLCEDAQAKIFADAKNWFYGAAKLKVNQEPRRQEITDRELIQDLQLVFPDIFCANLFQHSKYSVIAVGRDVKHRLRAGCLGLAAQICWESRAPLTETQQLVVDEVKKSRWFPQDWISAICPENRCLFR